MAKATKTAAKKKTTAKSKAATKKTAKKTTVKKATKAAAKKTVKKTVKKAVKKTAAKKTRKKTTKRVSSKTVSEPLIPTLDLERYEPQNLVENGVQDTFFGSTSYAWIGSGQCGGRIVKSFYDLGYHKTIAVNTTHHDLDLLDIPQDQKFLMDIGEKGAGKDMNRGADAVRKTRQELLHCCRKTFGTEINHIMVCIGAGGGTGGGSAIELVNLAKDYARSIGKINPSKHVGVIMTLPTVGEASSPQVAQNAYEVATELGKLSQAGEISPLIIVDNEKVNRMYPGMTVKEFWPSINNTVAGLFDVFNRLSALSSQYSSLDPTDYQSIMRSGGCAIMGLTKVNQFDNKFVLSQAVKNNLGKTLLADGFNLTTSKYAGCIVVGGKSLMATVPGLQDNINFAFDVLADITGKATIHRGIYEDERSTLRAYTIMGGLDFPTQRIEELIRK